MKLANLALAATLILAPAALLAQPPAPYANPHTATSRSIAARKGDQQGRIAQGDRSGQLTGRETSHLEHQEHAINHEERNMRAQDGGHLTRSDKATLSRQQNAESRRIDRDKHNAATRPPAYRR